MQSHETRNGVCVERQGEIVTVILDRPAVRNAVDGPTGQALADEFRAFENDSSVKVAVLFGDHGVFCSGADLSALASKDVTRSNRISPSGTIFSPHKIGTKVPRLLTQFKVTHPWESLGCVSQSLL